jgi:hypothetical protein
MKPFWTHLNKIPTGPKFLVADFLNTAVWIWIYVSDHKQKQLTPPWSSLELAVALMSSSFLLLQLVAVCVKRNRPAAEDSCVT